MESLKRVGLAIGLLIYWISWPIVMPILCILAIPFFLFHSAHNIFKLYTVLRPRQPRPEGRAVRHCRKCGVCLGIMPDSEYHRVSEMCYDCRTSPDDTSWRLMGGGRQA